MTRPDASSYPGCPWCEACQRYHGPLYVCPSYTEERKTGVRESAERWRRNVADGSAFPPDTPEAVKVIFRVFAGVEE